MFHSKRTKEGGCCKLSLALLMAQRASMSPQDWAQITFRSEIHIDDLKNESGSWLEKLKNQDLVNWAQYIYREFKKEFLLQLTTTNPLRLWLMAFKVVGKKESYVNARLVRFIVVKTQCREKNSCLGHPVYCAQITRSWFSPFSSLFLKNFLIHF